MIVNKLEIVRLRPNSGRYMIAGDPVPWARSGYNQKSSHIYDTQKPIKYVIASHIMEQHNGRPMYEGPLRLDITFYLKIPKVTKFKKATMIRVYHWTKPDLDNMTKLMKDIGTGLLYKDECQIAQIVALKLYDEEPRTEFTITELRI